MADINDTANIPLGAIGMAALDANSELPPATVPEILIITGMSGAGRTRAAATLEDLDWYVVDNLPPRLLSALAGLISPAGSVQRLAVVVDVRSGQYFSELRDTLDELRNNGIDYRIMFLDCDDATLIRRFESVRRPHPLQGDGRLFDGIRRERELLSSLKSSADIYIDTSTLSVHDLARKVREHVAGGVADTRITTMSFGFKYGLPVDADFVIDVRFLTNPYWVTELRHLTGHDPEVRDFVLNLPGAHDFVDGYVKVIEPVLAKFSHELKPFLTIAVGCTGGKHRSVAIAEEIARQLNAAGHTTRTIHRDLGRE